MAQRSPSVDTSGMSKKERIVVARELAAMEREDARYRRRRNRALLWSLVGVIALAIVAAAAVVLWQRYQESLAGPDDMGSDGILFTGDGSTTTVQSTGRVEPGGVPVATSQDVSSGTPAVVEYIDYSNPDSAAFTTAASSEIESWLTSGYITLEIHPVAPNADRDDYASRAANAVACVAQFAPDEFLAASDALMTAATADGFDGLDDDGIKRTLSEASASTDDVIGCIDDQRFAAWVEDATDRAETSIPNADVDAASTLPTIVVAGTTYTGAKDDADAFSSFVGEVYQATQGTTDGTSTDGTSTDGTSD